MSDGASRVADGATRTLWLLTLLSALTFMDRQILAVLTEPVKTEFGLSDLQIGVVTGLGFALCFGLVALPMGRWADRRERRGLVAWSRGVGGVMAALGALAPGAGWLMATRAGSAISDAGGGAASMSMIADLYPPQRRSRAMSVFTMGASLGSLLALVGGAWLAQTFGWRTTLVVVGGASVLLAMTLRWSVREPVRAASPPRNAAQALPSGAVGAIWANRVARRLLLAGSCALVAGYSFGNWNFAYLMRTHGLSAMSAGWVSGGAALGSVMGGLFAGALTDRLVRRDRRWQMGVPLLGLAAALPVGWGYLALASGHLAALAIAVAAFAFLISFWVAPTYAALSFVVPADRRATASAMMLLAGALLGSGLGPVLTGGLSDVIVPWAGADSLRWALACVISLLLGAVVFMAQALREYGRTGPLHSPTDAARDGPRLAPLEPERSR